MSMKINMKMKRTVFILIFVSFHFIFISFSFGAIKLPEQLSCMYKDIIASAKREAIYPLHIRRTWA